MSTTTKNPPTTIERTSSGPERIAVQRTGVASVDEAGEKYTQLLDRWKTNSAAYQEALGTRRAAEEADKRALADSLLASSKDPGEKHVVALNSKLGELARMNEGLRIAGTDAAAAYRAAISADRPEVERIIGDRISATIAAVDVDDLAAKLAAVLEARELGHWLASNMKPRSSGAVQRGRALAGLEAALRQWLAEPSALDPAAEPVLRLQTFGPIDSDDPTDAA